MDSGIQELHSTDPQIRMKAIFDCRECHDDSYLSTLLEIVLHDPDTQCRKMALFWLQRNDDHRKFIISGLQAALSTPELIREAAWNIYISGKKYPELVDLLISKMGDHLQSAFPFIVTALGTTKDQRVYEPLINILNSDNPFFRALAVQALGELGDKRAIAVLLPLAGDPTFAWTEDHGPDITIGDLAKDAVRKIYSYPL